ncbi:MAG TPA: SDR family NAD(P)-dependent oxidoreductase [Ilumatobacter sp.]|nr:SDR family NAD(P)-dependent oxidoreductase [Ilumatobacter sp.]
MIQRTCEDRVCIVTGAGGGIGRQHALVLAEQGALVVVNDVGASVNGAGASIGAAQAVVDEIEALGGRAVANTSDISAWDGAQEVVTQAVDTFGDLHVLINNAGILRDRRIVNMTEDEWDSVIRVHLKGSFACTRWAASYWRERSKAGHANDARIINTTSGSGLFGAVGQANYGAAKAGLAALTVIAAEELESYGVTVNAISPIALTRMTEGLPLTEGDEAEQAKVDPRWVAVMTSWLASTQSAGVTGRVFQVSGRVWAVAQGWHRGPAAEPVNDPREVDAVMRGLLSAALPNAGPGGIYPAASAD